MCDIISTNQVMQGNLLNMYLGILQNIVWNFITSRVNNFCFEFKVPIFDKKNNNIKRFSSYQNQGRNSILLVTSQSCNLMLFLKRL